MKFGIGQSVKRVEDKDLLIGQGRYTDDEMPGEGYAVAFLRSPYAHAVLTSLDISAAATAPGVIMAASHADMAADNVGEIHCQQYVDNSDGTAVPRTTKPAMIADIVRYAGDIAAMVVAETRQQAMDAIELIEADYDSMPAVCDVYAALEDGAPQLYDCYPNNVVFDWASGDLDGARAGIAAAKADGHKIIEVDIVNSRLLASALETRPIVAQPDGESLTLWLPSQGPAPLASQIAEALGMKDDELKVLTGHVGGGFGYKIFLHPEQLCVAWAARKIGSVVRWQQERSEAFLSDVHGRDNRTKAWAAVDKTGKILAMEVSVHANMGAWLSNFGIYIPTLSATRTLTGPYDIQTVGMRVRGIVTNTPAVDAFRGAGRPEANYLLERLMDHIAAELSIDRFELRRRNLIKPEQIPYMMVEGGAVDSGDMPGLLDEIIEKADVAGFAARRAESEAQGKYRGLGLAMYLEQCGQGGGGGVDIEFEADGSVILYAAQQDNGQGHLTTLTQIFSDRLGYDSDLIKVVQGDSLRTPPGTTGGAKMASVLGSSVSEAASLIAVDAQKLAAEHLGVDDADVGLAEGVFTASGTNQSISIEELVRLTATEDGPHPLNRFNNYKASGATYPYGSHIIEIEVDKASFVPQIVRYTTMDDFGNILNPLTLFGQIQGGIAQGVGQALYEHLAYDETGQLLSGSLMDYTLPRADHLPMLDNHTRNTPCQNNLLGVKGAGEAGAIGAPPAVISALCDALGVVHIDMPATLASIWKVMQAKKAAA